MNRLEQATADAINDLAAEGRPVNLAERSLRRSRQMRSRRRALIGVAAVAAAAALAVPYVALNQPAAEGVGGPGGDSTGTASAGEPIPGPFTLADGWIVGGFTTQSEAKEAGTVYVYDRAAREYRSLPYRFAVPAPTGSLVAVWDQGQVGIVDLASDAPVRWVTFPAGTRAVSGLADRPWSPDGTRLLVTLGDDPSVVNGGSDPGSPIMIVDAATATATKLPQSVQCGNGCDPVWLPGDRVGMNNQTGTAVAAFTAKDGASAGTLPLPGYVFGYPWSPDGKHVVLAVAAKSTSGPQPPTRVVVEASTGRAVSQPSISQGAAVYWTTNDRMLVVADDDTKLVSINGKELGSYPRPAELNPWSGVTLIRE